VFLSGNSELTLNHKDLEIELEDTRIDKFTRTLRLKVRNIGKKPIKLNSFLIGDFEIPINGTEKVLENGWGQSSFSGYVPIKAFTKKNRFFLKRDQNPFSFRTEFGYLNKSIVNEWYTQIVREDKSVVIGATTTKKQYSQIFLKAEKNRLRVRITSQFDSPQIIRGG